MPPSWLDRWRGAAPPKPERYPSGPVRDLAAAGWPDAGTPAAEVDYLVLDLETTGLDPRSDHVLSVGWVPLRHGEVVLAEATQHVVAVPEGVDVGDSATIHGLTDDRVAAARPLGDVLPVVLSALRGHVLVAHHAPVELGFLGRAVRERWDTAWPMIAVDTLRLQHRLVAGPHGEVTPGQLRLDQARSSFGLPRYRAHDALTDALGTAELLLAQVAELGHRSGREPTLEDLSPTRQR